MLSSALRVAVIPTKLLLSSFPPLENGFLDFPLLVFTLLFFIFYVSLASDKLFGYFSFLSGCNDKIGEWVGEAQVRAVYKTLGQLFSHPA